MTASEIKKVRQLQGKKFRDELGLFTVEGEKMVSEAVSSGFFVENIYRTEEIGEQTMRKISSLSSPSPVLAVVRKPETIHLESQAEIEKAMSGRGFFLALDSIRDPGNLGTILRVADWFGADAVFATCDTVDLFNPKVVQATMGAVFRVKFHYVDMMTLCDAVAAQGGRIYGTFLDGEDIFAKDLDGGACHPVVVVTGNESNGISPQLATRVDSRLFIPPYPAKGSGSESLNAAVATAITVAQFTKYRH